MDRMHNSWITDDPCLFALQGSETFAEPIAERLGLQLALHEERSFEDGEHKARPLVNVRSRDVYVIHRLHADHEHSPSDKLVRLLFFIGALKDAGAARVTAVVPLLAYARKDQKSQPRDPVTTRYVAQLFEAVGADRVMTLDVHNLAAFQNAFRCGTDHLEATGALVTYFASRFPDDALAVVAPDAGGIRRAERFRVRLAQALGRPIAPAFAEKHRAHGVVSGEALIGDVRDRVAIIVDDLIGTGTTLVRTAKASRAAGARTVVAAATHGLFVGEADTTLATSPIESIVVTDSVPPFRLTSRAARDKLVVLEVGRLFAEAIARVHAGGSVVELLQA